MMDVVYVCRDGENHELKYSLRTLENVDHDKVWIFGGAPIWIDTEALEYRPRKQSLSAYHSTRDHIAAACKTPEVSDPFMLWNDDFYAMQKIGTLPVYHRGSLEILLEKFISTNTPWGKGLRETASMLEKRGLLKGALSYDHHMPLVIHKAEMLEAVRWARTARSDAVHLRTLYGAIANLGGIEHDDAKMMRRSGPFPPGAWLSSGDDTFRSTVEPVLRYLFPNKSAYEKEESNDAGHLASHAGTPSQS